MISVEIAGPNLPETYTAAPDSIRSLTTEVINRCVTTGRGKGGFATMGIRTLVDYVVDPSSNLETYRKESSIRSSC